MSGDPLGADWAAAQAAGVAVLDRSSWTDDGDAYTVDGVGRPAPGTPSITSLVPATLAVTAPPQEVKVRGTNFARGDRVSFGGSTPPTSFHSSTELAVWVEPQRWSAGTVQVQVAYTPRGPSNQSPFTFT